MNRLVPIRYFEYNSHSTGTSMLIQMEENNTGIRPLLHIFLFFFKLLIQVDIQVDKPRTIVVVVFV